MSTSALSGSIDYLLSHFATALSAIDADGVVSEGIPVFLPTPPHPLIVVGMPSENSALSADETRQYLALGAMTVEESFSIPCYIEVRIEGGDQQTNARKSACTVFDAVVDVIRGDVTLGGNLLRGRFAQLSDITLIGTTDEAASASGRVATLSFHVVAQNAY